MKKLPLILGPLRSKALKVVFILFLLGSTLSYGQKWTLQGRVFDENHRSLPFASVALLSMVDSTLVGGITTDSIGGFVLSASPNAYLLKVSYVGYKAYWVSVDQSLIQGSFQVVLELDETTLEGVTIEAEKPLIIQQLDRIEFVVSNSVVLQGRSGWEAVKGAPGVLADNRGNITVNGRGGVVVYVNDRPTYMSGAELQEFLKGVSADDIESIEVISNPPAKYDAQGAVVINIKMKRDESLGFKGSIRGGFGYGVLAKYSTGISVNYRQKNIDFYGNYGYRGGKYLRNEVSEIDFLRSGNSTGIWDEVANEVTVRNAHSYQAGIDLFLGDESEHVLGIRVIGAVPNRALNLQANTRISNPVGSIDSLLENINNQELKVGNTAYNLNYQGDLGEGKTLSANFDYVKYSSANDQNLITTSKTPTGTDLSYRINQRSSSLQQIDILTGQVDYGFPVWDGMLELGAKTTFISTDNDLDWFIVDESGVKTEDPTRTNQFLYKEQNQAAYLSYSTSLENLEIQAGLRGEFTSLEGQSENAGKVLERTYFQLFPTVNLLYIVNENNMINVAYDRSIFRPEYWRLNPFRFYTNPFSYIEGNPFLNPQFDNTLQATYILQGQYMFTAFGQLSTDAFSQVSIQDNETNTLRYEQVNIGGGSLAGLSINAPLGITPWWTLYSNPTFYYQNLNFNYLGDEPFQAEQYNLDLVLNNEFIFPESWGLIGEVNFMYFSPKVQGAFQIDDRWDLTLGLSKSLFQDRGQLSVSFNDVAYTSNFSLAVNYQDQRHRFVEREENRNIQVSFSYRFGNDEVKASREREAVNKAERDRLEN